MTTLYVGNLPFSASEDEIRGLFGEHGTVDSVKIITDRDTGRPRGFAFVDMPADAAQKATAALNGFDDERSRAARQRSARAAATLARGAGRPGAAGIAGSLEPHHPDDSRAREFFLDGHELVLSCAEIVARPCLAGRLSAPGLLSRNVFDQVTGIARALALERPAMSGRIGY